ncbi:MAG: hypothetical protein ACJA2A_002079 [Cycloclasticus pugetii]|jgi:hypothetical protein
MLNNKQTQDLVPLKVWCAQNDKKETTVRSWKSKGNIREGKHIFKDPVGSLWISTRAMEDWVKSNYNQAAQQQSVRQIKIPKGRKPRQTLKTSNTLKVV